MPMFTVQTYFSYYQCWLPCSVQDNWRTYFIYNSYSTSGKCQNTREGQRDKILSHNSQCTSFKWNLYEKKLMKYLISMHWLHSECHFRQSSYELSMKGQDMQKKLQKPTEFIEIGHSTVIYCNSKQTFICDKIVEPKKIRFLFVKNIQN